MRAPRSPCRQSKPGSRRALEARRALALARAGPRFSRTDGELFLAGGDGRAHFGGEVLGLLDQTLTQRIAGVAANLDVLADHRHRGVHLVLHRALSVRIAEERLLQQAVVLVQL